MTTTPSVENVVFDAEVIAAQISDFFAPAGRFIELLAQFSGQRWGIVPENLFWFRPAGFHIFESLVIFPFLYTLWIWYGVPCTKRLLGSSKSSQQQQDINIKSPKQRNSGGFHYSVSKPAFFMDHVLGVILAVCWLAQVVFKASRPNPIVQLFWMCVPCHLITATWAYVLLSPPSWKNYRTCRFLAVLLSMSSWGGVMASLFPDWSDHQYRIEGFFFYLHHGALLLIPHYWAAKHGLLRLSRELFWTYIVVALGINFFIYTPLSYVSGVNINYNLHPHLGMKHRTQWYRFLVPSVLAVWGLAYWYFTVFLNYLYFSLFVSAQGGVGGRGNSYEVLSPVPADREAHSVSPAPSQSASMATSAIPKKNNSSVANKKRTPSGGRKKQQGK